MDSILKKILSASLVVIAAICIWGFFELKEFAHQSRNSQKMGFASSVGTPKSRVEVSTSSGTESQERVKESTADSAANPIAETKYTYADLLKEVQERPLIGTCKMLGAERLPLFRKLLERPKAFEILAMDQRLEIGLLAYHLPINQSLVLQLDETPSLVQDAKYSLAIYKAKQELEDSISWARQVEIHGYYARILAQIVSKNPSLLGDSEVMKLCDKFSNLQNPTTQEEMNKEVVGFMQRAQIKPGEIPFNPNFRPTVEVTKGPDGNFIYFSKKLPQ